MIWIRSFHHHINHHGLLRDTGTNSLKPCQDIEKMDVTMLPRHQARSCNHFLNFARSWRIMRFKTTFAKKVFHIYKGWNLFQSTVKQYGNAQRAFRRLGRSRGQFFGSSGTVFPPKSKPGSVSGRRSEAIDWDDFCIPTRPSVEGFSEGDSSSEEDSALSEDSSFCHKD